MKPRKPKPSGIEFISSKMEEQQEYADAPKKHSKKIAALQLVGVTGVICVFTSLLAAPFAIPPALATMEVNHAWESLPSELPEAPLPQRSRILDVDGNQIAEFYSENRIITPLANVSPFVTKALIATEDARFYEHGGVDPQGIVRAAVRTAQGSTQGASTITQQLVKNTLLVNADSDAEAAAATEVSASRKIQEIRYAVELEKVKSKEQILQDYLNIALFSNGVYGIGTAANYYFSKEAKDLTLSESALLVGLVQNPSGYDPLTKPEEAKKRRNIVLGRMATVGDISEEEKVAAQAEEIVLKVQRTANGCYASPYPFYCQWVVDTLRTDPAFGATEEERAALVYRGGLTITTPLDPRVQKEAQDAADDALGRGNRVATGIAVVQPGTGNVVAMAQNRSWGSGEESTKKDKKTEIIYPTRPAFQPGSTFKIFTLAAALEAGYPTTGVINAPTRYTSGSFNTPPGGIRNLAGYHAGPLTLAQGTARSSNTFYTTLQAQVGVLGVAEMAESLGINVPREGANAVGRRDASFTLGTIDVSPLQMSAAYATFAARGVYCEPVGMISVKGPSGEDVNHPDGDCRQAVSQQTADNVSNILSQVIDGSDEFRTGKAMSLGRPAGGKTGTTNNASAVWFVGYTPQYSTAVWVGDPRGGVAHPLTRSIKLYGENVRSAGGSTLAGPIWKDVMEGAVAPLPAEPLAKGSATSAGNIVPDVRGLGVAEAVSLLTAHGYSTTISGEQAPANEFSTPDQVAAQNPPAGQRRYSSDADITLTLTNGSRTDWRVNR